MFTDCRITKKRGLNQVPPGGTVAVEEAKGIIVYLIFNTGFISLPLSIDM